MAYGESQKGFSLVELSMVLVIIGLIVGGIMAGNALIDSARLNSITADIEQFSQATDTFEATYGGLPGDIGSVAALPPVTPAPTPGNGNGAIDTAGEALQFWYQLMAAQLIPGSYDGTSTYVLATSGQTGGVPGSKIPQSGYSVTTNSNGLVITFGTFSSSSSTLAALTPAEAMAIDQKLDDGKPTTGIVQAANGAGSSGCVSETSNAYASTTSDTPTCILVFTIARSAVTSTSASSVTCSGVPAGTSRISSTATCPSGYTGTIIESCLATQNSDGTWSGTWTNIRKNCTQITCGDGYVTGDTRTVECPAGYTNVNFTQTCQPNGLWQNTNAAPCGTARATVTGSCTYGQAYFLPCPLGQTGTQVLACTQGGTWPGTYTSSCSSPTCTGSVAIGSDSASTLACPSGYGSSGKVTQSCTINLSLQPTTNTCIPSSSCTSGQTLACPQGYTGTAATCNSNGYWNIESCVPVTCGGQPIGAFRRALGVACPKGSIGTVYEMCGSDGKWTTVTTNCSAMQCPRINDTSTTAYWATSNPGTWSVYASSCAAGSTAAARDCQYNGSWGTVRGSCAVSPCSAIDSTAGNSSSNGYASWPQTNAGSSANGTCIGGYTGSPTRSCTVSGNAGVWGTVSNPCTALCAAITTASSSSGYATWPQTNAGATATGTCQSGYSGSPTRSCTLSGSTATWGTISNACTPNCAAITTASSSTGYATWPQTSSGSTATGTCQSGYGGAPTPTRTCNNGTWGTISGTCIQQCQTSSTACSSSNASSRTASNCAKYYIASNGNSCSWDGSNCVVNSAKKCSPTSTPNCYGSGQSSCSNIGATASTCANYYNKNAMMQCTWGTGSGAYCYNGGSTCK